MTLDPTLIAVLSQAAVVIWMFSGLHFRVKELEKGFHDNKVTNEKLRSEVHDLSLVAARSDEKLVQLVREHMYANGNGTSKAAPRKRKRVDEAG